MVAFVLALTINPKVKIRPNLFLGLYSLLAIVSLAMSIRLIGIGTDLPGLPPDRVRGRAVAAHPVVGSSRSSSCCGSQMRFLVLILITVVVGLVLSPHKALAVNFGSGAAEPVPLWPIPTTQVAHYMAELAGLTILLWMCRYHHPPAGPVLIVVPSIAALIATHTRTALIGMVVGLVVAGLSLFTTSRRVRRVVATAVIVGVVVALPLAPLLSGWLVRGQTTAQFSNLSGRTLVWPLVLAEPRPETNKIFGSGLSNGSVIGQTRPSTGCPIDSSWIATYQDQGLVGDVARRSSFSSCCWSPRCFDPRGPARAMALFLIVYCLFASFTETGMGEASPYLLDLTVARPPRAHALAPGRHHVSAGAAV